MDKDKLIWVRQLLKDNAPLIYNYFADKKLNRLPVVKSVAVPIKIYPPDHKDTPDMCPACEAEYKKKRS